jgi:hypothetical protein
MSRMDKHDGWQIGVAARARSGGQWSAKITVWNPGAEPAAADGRAVPFINRHDTRRIAEREAIAFAKRWIDKQR